MTIEDVMNTSDGLGAPVPRSGEVYVVELVGEEDPIYVFTRDEDAERFAAAATLAGHEVYQSDEPLIDSAEHVRALLDALEDEER